MQKSLDGTTRVHFIVGDPIAQVKSPAGVSQTFRDRGHNAVVLPAHVTPTAFPTWLRGVSEAQNVDGIIVTIPHKFSAFKLCSSTSERASLLCAANTMRRNPDGSWHGDMFDGLGFVEALRNRGGEPLGKKALLIGAGGAGSAIALALVMAGVASLEIHDDDLARRAALIALLNSLGRCSVVPGSRDPRGAHVIINATPMGMKVGDAMPFDTSQLTPQMFVGCVITAPVVSPVIKSARDAGCGTVTGTDMFGRVKDLMVDFLLNRPTVGSAGDLGEPSI
jgi:shikimate dehydrogenase